MKDFNGYVNRMEGALQEKLFFLNKTDLNKFDIVFDFGCANGILIKNLEKKFSNIKFFGYDFYPKMIESAKQLVNSKNVYFSFDLKEFEVALKAEGKKAIIFSSVLHEIPQNFLITAIDFMKQTDCVIIRDMFFDDSLNKNFDCESILNHSLITAQMTNDFEKRFGKIDNIKNLYHMLLKYTYTDNWQTEIEENYFSVNYNQILTKLNDVGFKVFYDNKHTLPFKKTEIKNNFNFDLNLPTHRKLILIK